MLAYNALISTPRGYRYLYNCRPGTPIWTYEHDQFKVVPLEYEILDRHPLVNVRITQQQHRLWEGQVIQAGQIGHVFPFMSTDILTVGGYMPITEAQSKRLPRIPWTLLGPKARPFQKFRHIEGKPAFDKLVANLQKPWRAAPDQPLPVPALGPLDCLIEFGGDKSILDIKAMDKNVPAVKLSTNAISQGIIVKGD